MVDRVERMIEVAGDAGSRFSEKDIHESVEFLQWLTDDNFIYLGYREYEIQGDGGSAVVSVVPESGLGIMSDPDRSSYATGVPLAEMTPALRGRMLGGPLVVISKTNRETTIHRAARMDYIGVRRVSADGRMIGELRMVGLFTSKITNESARLIPIVRRKLDSITRWEDLFAGSHDHKAVVALFDSFPKDELFTAPAQELRHVIMTLLGMAEGRAVRLFVLHDEARRSVFAIVALPPDHVSAGLRARLEHLLEVRFGGTSVEHHIETESDPARFHFTIHVPEGDLPDVDLAAVEQEVAEASRSWDDRLSDAVVSIHGAQSGHQLAARYSALFPDYYKSASKIYQAVFDVTQFEQLSDDRPYVVALQNERHMAEPLTRLKLYKTGGKAPLTDLLPLLEQLGLTVVEEVPTRLQGDAGETRYLHDFGVLGPDGNTLDLEELGALVGETFGAVWDGRAGSDWLNRLVVAGRLSWRQVTILRAYREYRQLLGAQFTSRYQNDCLVRNSHIARRLVELFEALFDPTRELDTAAVDAIREGVLADLEDVTSLDDDRILRGYLGLVDATVRTNAYVRGGESEHISFKLRCADVPGIPKPVPLWEIFVFSPAMAGVHLRGGYVARGGIRWSDRLEDYRTEILGLMKAQMVKNAVIVPVGAKGGFILKRPPSDRAALMEEERRQYITLMRGLLDVTDNIVGGEVVQPADVRVLDEGADAYLVVAADKGTAHLSDTANEVSLEYGFWLGDAFASGGSAGYDHKALGITAKGAWESVKRHFRELGRDVMTEPFTVAGVGDMSGDVFGNGMQLSPVIRLVAAFDHRHIFIDPDPNHELALIERRRLFSLPSSSWDDYDRSLISEGGGVWPRSAKSIPVSTEAREALGIEAESLAPTDLIQAILKAPVDLLWNGGIGTYVKASTESHTDVGDRANDAVRVDGSDLRSIVVGEGGNLGFTQLGRIEYALGGGKINTDAIDNSAGVDCSDHEVNLKILLALPVDAGALTVADRDSLLQTLADDVVHHVLYDNYLQVQILSQETGVSARRMEAYEDLMLELERNHLLDRRLEFLPSSERMAERAAAGQGMARPELCVLLAYAKRLLRDQILASDLPDDPYLQATLNEYFPRTIVERFGDDVLRHPLRRELLVTMITNDVVNSMGMTFVQRMVAETGATASDAARAFLVARDVSNARFRWDDVETLDGVLDGSVQTALMDGVDGLVEQLTRWYLRNPSSLGIADEVGRDRTGFGDVVEVLRSAGPEGWRVLYDERLHALEESRVPERAALFGAGVPALVFAPDILMVVRSAGRSLAEVTHAFFAVGERLYLDQAEQRVTSLPATSRWQRLANQALIDDLRLLRRHIVSTMLAEGGDGDVDAVLDAYLDERAEAYARLTGLIESIGPTASDDGSLAMVMVHQIRQVVS